MNILLLTTLLIFVVYILYSYIYEKGYKEGEEVSELKWKPVILQGDLSYKKRKIISDIIFTYTDTCYDKNIIACDKVNLIESILTKETSIFSKYSNYIRKLPSGFIIEIYEGGTLHEFPVVKDGDLYKLFKGYDWCMIRYYDDGYFCMCYGRDY